ncbi:hypothetical protein ASZ90_005584 [hydrocarbon metagenome]|uniref:Uncharacterized protein n=1 Tax=hydrocarbon metagenome TaxID=938273 RepID=A0A0W8FV57_9ZZZZ
MPSDDLKKNFQILIPDSCPAIAEKTLKSMISYANTFNDFVYANYSFIL